MQFPLIESTTFWWRAVLCDLYLGQPVNVDWMVANTPRAEVDSRPANPNKLPPGEAKTTR